MSAMNKMPRILIVLVVMAIFAVLIWKLAVNTDYFYLSIGIVVLITTGVILAVYRVNANVTSNQKATDVVVRYRHSSSEAAAKENDSPVFIPASKLIQSQEPGPISGTLEYEPGKNAAPTESPRHIEPPVPLIEDKSTLTEEDKNELVNAVWYRCENPFCKYTNFLSVHHIVDEKDGGTNRLDNLIVLCPYCHDLAHKNDIPVDEMRKWIGNREERFKSKLSWHYN